MNQYKTGTRTPKEDLTKMLSLIFNVSTHALNVPDIDTDLGLIHAVWHVNRQKAITLTQYEMF